MPAYLRYLAAVILAAVLAAPAHTRAETFDPAAAIAGIADRSSAISQVQTILRVSEDMAFWQGVALMGAAFGWSVAYNTEGNEVAEWTLRLQNALGDSENEVVQARRTFARLKGLEPDQVAALENLVLLQEDMREASHSVYKLLTEGKVDAAKDVYSGTTIQLRRDISGAAYSLSSGLARDISKTALMARTAFR